MTSSRISPGISIQRKYTPHSHSVCRVGEQPFAQRSWHNYSVVNILERILPELPAGTDLYLVTPFVDEKTSELLHYATHQGRNIRVIPLRTRRFV